MADRPHGGLVPIWIALGLGLVVGRIARVESPHGDTVMLSANDRSRWCTIRALGDHGTFLIDSIIRERDPRTGRRVWHTIDRVRHRGWDGKEHDYSSKPPLLPVLLTGEYVALRTLTGASFATHPYYVMRVMLAITNGGMLALMWYLMGVRLIRWRVAAWTFHVLMAMATLGTFLTTFSVTLNNHLPAAFGCLLAAEGVLRIMEGDGRLPWFVLAGAGSAWAAVNELPALSLVAAVGGCLLLVSPRRMLLGFIPPVLLLAAAFFGTTWWAHGSWRPPYAHRDDGAVLAAWDAAAARPPAEPGPVDADWRRRLKVSGIELGRAARWERTADRGRWAVFDPASGRRWAVRFSDGGRVELRAWDDWYDYAGSYWRKPRGIDRGEPRRDVYAFHVLIGHHGVLSLTPFWWLSLAGLIWSWRREDRAMRWLAAITTAITLVCVIFFIFRPLADRNYGGMTTGFRWLFWLIPCWWLAARPAVERLERHGAGRALVAILLAVSIFSAAYGAMQPWSQPWLFTYWRQLGWL